ncbi:MAG: hypothetical protein KQH83_03700 [Actinobacteria bacterium]|nr:hypothetical protein [Actinomycetota bacterium]
MTDSGFDMQRITGSTSTMTAIIGAVVTIIGSFTAWASFAGMSIGGMEEPGDGLITLIVAIAAAAVAVFLKDGARKWGLVATGAIVVVVAITNMLDINDAGFSIGFGLWLTLIGGAVMAAAAFIKR